MTQSTDERTSLVFLDRLARRGKKLYHLQPRLRWYASQSHREDEKSNKTIGSERIPSRAKETLMNARGLLVATC